MESGKAVVFLRIVTAVLMCSAVLCVGCGGSGEETGDGQHATEILFDDWDSFVASNERAKARPQRVVVVGGDGIPWHFLDKLIEQGDMPNLARIKKEGSYAALRSTRAYVTPPAWVSMFTGYLPEETGVYSFGKWVRDERQFVSVTADDVETPSVWDAASRAGLKTGVFNVPMTWPPYRVNGAMVTGMMTPIDARDAITVWPLDGQRFAGEYWVDPNVTNYSRPVHSSMGDSLNVFLVVMHDTKSDNVQDYDKASVRILSIEKGIRGVRPRELGVYTFDVGEYSPWLPIRYREKGDIVDAWTRIKLPFISSKDLSVEVSQVLLPLDVPYTYPETLADTLAAEFGFYLPTKFLSKEVVPALTGDMASYMSFLYGMDKWDIFQFVFTQTDNIHHLVGFSERAAEVYRVFDRAVGEIMEKMPDGSTLIIASDHGNGVYRYCIDLNQFFKLLGLLEWESPGRIDHQKTLVFHNLWHVYFDHNKLTREELAGRGIDVPPGEDPYEILVRYITEAGRQLHSPDGAHVFPLEFHRVHDRKNQDDPDMWVVGSYGEYICDYWNIKQPHGRMIREARGADRFWHIRDGVFLAWGKGIRSGYDAGTKNIEDVAPTILYLAGLPLAPDMDGRLMEDIFEQGMFKNKPRFVNTGYRDIQKEAVLDAGERDSLEEKLRSLGYIR